VLTYFSCNSPRHHHLPSAGARVASRNPIIVRCPKLTVDPCFHIERELFVIQALVIDFALPNLLKCLTRCLILCGLTGIGTSVL